MTIELDGHSVFATTGGVAPDPALPLVIFLHGAGMDQSVWALQSRGLAWGGFRVLAVDLPGHGRSGGVALDSIADLADWVARLVDAACAEKAVLVGHSMGSLIALETAARHPERVAALALLGTAAKMPVSGDLLAAAKANDHDAIDMVALWGLGPHAIQGGSPTPGLWMLGGAQRLLERAAPGVLHTDLAACNAYADGPESAAKVAAPTLLILGERDQMTPAKAGRALAALIPGARVEVLPGAGHMMMIERPDEVLAALRRLVGRP